MCFCCYIIVLESSSKSNEPLHGNKGNNDGFGYNFDTTSLQSILANPLRISARERMSGERVELWAPEASKVN